MRPSKPAYETGYRRCEDCGRLFYLVSQHKIVAPVTCRRVHGRGDLGSCIPTRLEGTRKFALTQPDEVYSATE